eukprot:scaffold69065_cov75-Phaeocystis_antarctica.AAC.2
MSALPHRTAHCHASLRGVPVCRSTAARMKPVQLPSPPPRSSSRRSISCRPSQLVPLPSPLSDQTLSRPATCGAAARPPVSKRRGQRGR